MLGPKRLVNAPAVARLSHICEKFGDAAIHTRVIVRDGARVAGYDTGHAEEQGAFCDAVMT
jgi:hypothetical protein